MNNRLRMLPTVSIQPSHLEILIESLSKNDTVSRDKTFGLILGGTMAPSLQNPPNLDRRNPIDLREHVSSKLYIRHNCWLVNNAFQNWCKY